MFVLIWATLLFSVRGSHAGPSIWREDCTNGVCFTEGETTAEAGLCVVIPCKFTSRYAPRNIVWYKCEPSKQSCGDSDIILQSDREVESGFKGRVSLLLPDVSQRTCSIIINDITESDSGSYQLRVNSDLFRRGDGYSSRVNVSVKDLIQKPTVMIPPLIEGQQTTLTCTAPGLCSGSEPKITWMWRGAGEKASHITENIARNIPGFKYLTAATQRHSSTLMFNLSAEHHGSEVTCKVTFTNNITTEETVTLNVTYMKQVKITGNTSVKKGEALNLTCSVDSVPPPSHITWTILGSNINLHNGPDADLQNDKGSNTLVIPNVTAEDSGRYICTAQHLDKTVTAYADVTVTWLSRILNSGCMILSDVLTCVCISEGFPLPTIKWPLLENHAEYSVITTVSHHTVHSTATLTVKDHSNTVVECVSSSEVVEMRQTVTIISPISQPV